MTIASGASKRAKPERVHGPAATGDIQAFVKLREAAYQYGDAVVHSMDLEKN